jgi:hypothetical protein
MLQTGLRTQIHGGVTVMSRVEEMLLPNSRQPGHGSKPLGLQGIQGIQPQKLEQS